MDFEYNKYYVEKLQKVIAEKDKRIKELEDLNRLKDIGIKALEERNDRLNDIIELDMKEKEEKEKELIDMSIQFQYQMEGLNKEIAQLKTDLSLNASMLAHQCDLAREAETKEMKAVNEIARLKEELARRDDYIEGCLV